MKKWIVRILAVALILAGVQTALLYRQVRHLAGRICDDTSLLPTMPEGIVFGASVLNSGKPGAMLDDRIRAGVAAYKAGKVKRLLMTGSHYGTSYNEALTMRAEAVRQGVPFRNIDVDALGTRTYESLHRARDLFHIRKAILVTQQYHLGRALYLAQELQIEAVGLAADHQGYGSGKTFRFAREVFATELAWWDLHVRHRSERLRRE